MTISLERLRQTWCHQCGMMSDALSLVVLMKDVHYSRTGTGRGTKCFFLPLLFALVLSDVGPDLLGICVLFTVPSEYSILPYLTFSDIGPKVP